MNNLNINQPIINPTSDRDRQVTIKFTGGYLRARPFVESTCKITVPYNSFSKKLQEIQRRGGKIVNVSLSRFETELLVDGDITPQSIIEVIPAIATNLVADVVAESLPEESLVEISINESPEPLVAETIVLEDLAQHLPENPSVEEVLVTSVKTPETLPESSIIINAEPLEVLSEVKSPKSKATSKSASGFNKPKASTKAPRTPRKPKS